MTSGTRSAADQPPQNTTPYTRTHTFKYHINMQPKTDPNPSPDPI